MPAKKSAPKKSKSFEESLWETATKLRGSVESSEYKHVVLSLIFLKFVESHHGNTKDISVYGQEMTNTTYKLAKMNLAVRGLSANLGEVAADTFFKDQHTDLKADYIMANPPFNLKDWRGPDELVHDARWGGYDPPPTGNANYAWILHMVSKLSEHGVAGLRPSQRRNEHQHHRRRKDPPKDGRERSGRLYDRASGAAFFYDSDSCVHLDFIEVETWKRAITLIPSPSPRGRREPETKRQKRRDTIY